MKRFAFMLMVVLGTAAAFAQAPKGWKMRVDRSSSASDPDAPGAIKFMAMGGGFHFVNPQAAKAVEVQQDLKAGFYNDEEKEGEPDEPGQSKKGLKPTDEGGGDA